MTSRPVARSLLHDGPEDAALTLALAHGAGAAMDTPFMEAIAGGLADAGFRVVRFEFPYMAKRRADGRKRPPDRAPVLRETFVEVAEALAPAPLAVGGKSMGGRIASEIADAVGARALVCLGYPFHAPGRPEKVRADHLAGIRTPTLILQGERDPFGGRDEIAGYDFSPRVRLHFLPDGEHSFKPRKASGHTGADNLKDAVAATVDFLKGLAPS